MSLHLRNLYKCKQVACSVTVACLLVYPLFLYCTLLLLVYFFIPFFKQRLLLFVCFFIAFFKLMLLYFSLFVDHVNKPIIFDFGVFVYHFKNTISIFVTISYVYCLNWALARIFLIATANGLCLNPGKSKCILLHRRSVVPIIPRNVVMNGEKIEIVHETRNLGIIYNSNLTWHNHINSLVGRTYIKLRTLLSMQLYIPFEN